MKRYPYSVAAFYFAGFLCVILAAGWLYQHMQSSMDDQVYRQFLIDSDSRLNSLEDLLDRTSHDFQTYAEIPSFKSFHFHNLTLNPAAAREDIRRLELYFLNLQKSHEDIDCIRFISLEGSEILKVQNNTITKSLSDVSQVKEVQDALALNAGMTHVSLDFLIPDRKTITWWLPVYASSTVRLGVLSFRMDFDFLVRAVEHATQPGRTQAILVDGNGELIYDSHDSAIDDPGLWRVERALPLQGLNAKIILAGRKDALLSNVRAMNRLPFFVLTPLLVALIVLLASITIKRMHAERKIQHLAYFDRLTGLVNRNQLEERLKEALKHSRDTGIHHAFLYIDLDQFKIVNDAAGHMAGDQLLEQLAALLKRAVRTNDTLARWGGDEFALLLEGCPEERARVAANTIRQLIADFRFVWNNKPFTVGASIGIALIGDRPVDFDTVLSRADMACRMAKELGRNRVHTYTEDDENLTRRHGEIRWVSRLKQALENDWFFLECQRIVPTNPVMPNYFWEILVRIKDEGRTIYPNAFIPAAERYGLMPQVDRWVVGNALRFLGELPDKIGPRANQVTFFINISGISVGDPEFLTYVKDVIQANKVDPRNVCFEVTETATIANFSVASEFIENINRLGCKMALDDFGSGLCSFNYLKHLPVSFIKIDGTFVEGMLQDAMDRVIVGAIKQIGDAASLSTIAEFVSDARVLKELAEIGVDYAQGFGIARPQPIDSLIGELNSMDDAANDS